MKQIELNQNEIVLARMIGQCLKSAHVGRERAVLTKSIIGGMKRYAEQLGVRLTDVRIRKFIQWLRVTNECTGLCSTTNGGYFVAANIGELERCCENLRERMSNQYQTERALRRQLNEWRNQAQTKLNLQS